MNTLNPPTDNPNLPSFCEAEYLDAEADLQLVLDCWSNLKGRKSLYLPQEEHEPTRAYNSRLERTRFDNRFAPAIRGHAGLLSDFSLTEDAPKSLRLAKENIDLQGNDLESFCFQLDLMVLRDGGVGVLVEYPREDPSIVTSADLAESGRRPYLIPIDRRNILNWETETIEGRPIINRVVIREFVKVRSGAFGSKLKTCYRVLFPGGFQIFEIVQAADESGWKAVLIDEGETDLDRVPLAWYSVTDNHLFQGVPPFLNLANLNIEHLQKRSSLNEVLHKCNLPVPVRRGFIRNIADLAKPLIKLVIGANSVVDIPHDGDFFFAEPTGSAIAASQADIEKLEGAMDRESLAFLNGGEAQKTATEVLIDSAQMQCSLKGMARKKENLFQSVAVLWCLYTGEKPSNAGAGMRVNESILQPAPNAQDVQLILDHMGIKFSNKLGLMMLIDRRWLPADTDIDQELALIEQVGTEILEPLAEN